MFGLCHELTLARLGNNTLASRLGVSLTVGHVQYVYLFVMVLPNLKTMFKLAIT